MNDEVVAAIASLMNAGFIAFVTRHFRRKTRLDVVAALRDLPVTLAEFHALPTIASFFPITYAQGGRWTTFDVRCNDCGRMVPSESTRGSVEREIKGDYRSSHVHYRVTAFALCPTCVKMTKATYVLRDDLTIEGEDPRTGERALWGPIRKRRWLERWFKR